MRIFLTILFCVISFFCFGQVITTNTPGAVGRSGRSVKDVEDFNLGARANFFVPRMNDTTQANTNNNNFDSCGRLVYTYDVDAYWYRACNPSKHWVQVTNGGAPAILPSCGLGTNGLTPTGFISYDSSTTSASIFDIKGGVYALCCDHQARILNDTVIAIATPIDSTNPAYVGIFLGRTGVFTVTGTPAPNPELPQSSDSCALLLSYVQFAAGQSQPTFVTNTNPFVIYDETFSGEWLVDTVHLVTVDTANTTFPAHLQHDLLAHFSNNGAFKFQAPTPIDLNNYGVLKLYARRPSGATALTVFLTFFLDSVQQTLPIPFSLASAVGYQTIVIPTANIRTINSGGTIVNQLKITIQGTPSDFYLDWIQLQAGIPIVNNVVGGGTLTNWGSGNLDSLLIPSVANASTTPLVSYTKFNVAPFTVLTNPYNVTGQYEWNKIDLSTPTVKGLLPIINLAPSSSDGDFVQTVAGVSSWVTVPNDTILAGNWLRLHPDGNGNDTLTFGDRVPDSSLLRFETYVGFNGFSWHIQRSGFDLVRFSPTDTLLLLASGVTSGSVGISVIGGVGQALIEDVGQNSHFFAFGTGVAFNGQADIVLEGDAFNGPAIFVDNFTLDATINATNQAGGVGMFFNTVNASINTIQPVLEIERSIDNSLTLPSNGIGAYFTFILPTINGGLPTPDTAMRIISKLTDVTYATRTSQFSITLLNSGSTSTPFILDGNGTATFSGSLKLLQGSTGATTVVLGTNSPATLAATAPYTWFTMIAPDGTTVYVPAWK